MTDPALLTYMRAARGAWAVDGLRALIATLPANLVMAEIGVFAGESTRLFMESGKVQLLYAIDAWRAYEQGDGWRCPWSWVEVRKCFDTWAAAYPQIRTFPLSSERAAGLVPDGSLDLVYIDACHDYASVKADIARWAPKLKATGLLAGHDYSPAYVGVVKAVAQACRSVQRFDDTSWLCPVAELRA